MANLWTEQSSGLLLIGSTVIAVLMANSALSAAYTRLWAMQLGNLSLAHWVNDGLMAIFFLLIGLELKRSILIGELSSLKKASLPVVAAVGGMIVPASIYYLINQGAITQAGIGIPMATDIAFALAALALSGSRVPPALKIFVIAFAVIDDLGAIIVIAAFYTAQLSIPYLIAAFAVWLLLLALNKVFKLLSLTPYLIGGIFLWLLMLKSGIHATIAGVLLAFVIPFRVEKTGYASASQKLEILLHRPVSFIILPIFALANTGVVLNNGGWALLSSLNSIGILAGLVIGKPIGIFLFSWIAATAGLCELPQGLRWSHIAGAGILGGIGFTMSLFITNLAFPMSAELVNSSKAAIMAASLIAGICGMLWLRILKLPQ